MKKSSLWLLLAAAVAALVPMPAFAEEVARAATGGGAANVEFFKLIVIMATGGMTIAAVGAGICQMLAVRSAVDGIARNPGASGKILPALLLGLAMIESLAIYVLVIALILLFANPFFKFLV